MNTLLRLMILCGALVATACQSTPGSTPEDMYRLQMQDLDRRDGSGSFDRKVIKRQMKRWDQLRDMAEQDALESPADQMFAAAVLVRSHRPQDIPLAKELAQSAVDGGEDRALPVLAEATDKVLVQGDRRQKYGTQHAYNWFERAFRLYPVDPSTTDAERIAMGLMTLAEMEALVEELNRSEAAKLLRGE